MVFKNKKGLSILTLSLAFAACDTEGQFSGNSDSTTPKQKIIGKYSLDENNFSHQAPTSRMQDLQDQIKNTIWLDCKETADCEKAGFRTKACGGFQQYLVYSKTSTDTDWLNQLLNAYNEADREHQKDNRMISTCDYLMPPTVTCSENKCSATEN